MTMFHTRGWGEEDNRLVSRVDFKHTQLPARRRPGAEAAARPRRCSGLCWLVAGPAVTARELWEMRGSSRARTGDAVFIYFFNFYFFFTKILFPSPPGGFLSPPPPGGMPGAAPPGCCHPSSVKLRLR